MVARAFNSRGAECPLSLSHPQDGGALKAALKLQHGATGKSAGREVRALAE